MIKTRIILVFVLSLQMKFAINTVFMEPNTMYICLCYGVTRDDIQQSTLRGASVEEIQDKFKAGKCCGCCMDEVKSVHCHTKNTMCVNKLQKAA